MSIKTVTDASFEADVLAAEGPVLVDFWAGWCGPCKMIGAVLDEIAGEDDSLAIAKLDIDANSDIPTRYGVRSIPTIILFNGGKPVATKVGAAPRGQLRAWIGEHAQSCGRL